MRGEISPSTGRRYALTMIGQVYRRARSSVYTRGATLRGSPPTLGKRGPRTRWSDAEIVGAAIQC